MLHPGLCGRPHSRVGAAGLQACSAFVACVLPWLHNASQLAGPPSNLGCSKGWRYLRWQPGITGNQMAASLMCWPGMDVRRPHMSFHFCTLPMLHCRPCCSQCPFPVLAGG